MAMIKRNNCRSQRIERNMIRAWQVISGQWNLVGTISLNEFFRITSFFPLCLHPMGTLYVFPYGWYNFLIICFVFWLPWTLHWDLTVMNYFAWSEQTSVGLLKAMCPYWILTEFAKQMLGTPCICSITGTLCKTMFFLQQNHWSLLLHLAAFQYTEQLIFSCT